MRRKYQKMDKLQPTKRQPVKHTLPAAAAAATTLSSHSTASTTLAWLLADLTLGTMTAECWRETKEEPDLWKIEYKTSKRRARKAPEKSGAPVGTEYHWLIVAHQHVRKIDANTYETHLEGSKCELAHKGPTSKTWSIPTVKGQRDRELELLHDAKRRVQGLPPVLGSEKVKAKTAEKGQQKLEDLFSVSNAGESGSKRKRDPS
ncbi:hypothetical protein J3F83DRAFT_328226 [Trichoderma novae-zelandiae]